MTRDIIVLGGGPGGYALGIRLAQRGLDTVVVEQESLGGVCLNWGCMPSKALITTAQRWGVVRDSKEFGIDVAGAALDLPRAQRRSRDIVRHHTGGVASLLRSNGAAVVNGRGRLLSPRSIDVTTGDGQSQVIEASRGIVVATGARPRQLTNFTPDGEHVVTAKEGVFLDVLPEHLIVLGGGVIGVELGTAYMRLGSRLTLVEMGGSLLPGVDDDVKRVVIRRLERNGAQVLTDARALGWEPTADGVRMTVARNGESIALEGTSILVSAGFTPNTQGIGLETLGVALDASGHILTNDRCETTVPGVYAIGDVAGPPYLAHKAYKEAEVLAAGLMGRSGVRDWRVMPAAIFSDPEIATVGLNEVQARQQFGEVVVGKFPFSALGRAMALGETDGFVKLIAVDDRLVGAAVVGPEASELVSELTLAIETGATLEDLALTVHSHPTLAEAIGEAAAHGRGEAVHVLNRVRAKHERLAPVVSG